MDLILAANDPDRWVQLAGNHECAALGGPAKSDWDVDAAFESECVEFIRHWWSCGRMKLAHSEGDALFTHAGLTRQRWVEIGGPTNASDAAILINRTAGQPISNCVPGSLVSGIVTPNADTMWAEVNHELLLPWLEHDDLKFDQVHGHAAPFRWSAEDWWPGTPELVKRKTRADCSLRRSVTTLSSGRQLISVDWMLGDDSPRHLWPLLSLGDSGGNSLMADAPLRWRDPGLLVSISDCNSGAHYAVVSGPRARVAVWERRWEVVAGCYLPSIHRLNIGSLSVLTDFKTTSDLASYSFEIDISWNSSDEEDRAMEAVDELLPPTLSRLVRSLPGIDRAAINENRALEVDPEFRGLGVRIVDIPVNSLPSSRQRSRPLVMGTRWVRLILLSQGLIALWYPASPDIWDAKRVSWPHTAVPSRSREHLDRIRSGGLTPVERQVSWARDLVDHEKYFKDSWLGELEFWQDAAFTWLTKPLTLRDVAGLRDELGLLSQYVTSIRWTERAVKRRHDEAGLASSYPDIGRVLLEETDSLSKTLPLMRRGLTESFEILSTISQRVQEEEAEKSRESTERLNWLITLFTAILFVPTIVSGIYGANVSSLTSGATGTIGELLVLMSGAALISYGLLSVVSRQWGKSALGVGCGMFAVALFEIPYRAFNAPIGVAWSSLLPEVICIVGLVISKRNEKIHE